MRDITTLQSLGFHAPKLTQIVKVIDDALDADPNLLFDEAILQKFRYAVRQGLLAFYYQNPEYLKDILLNPNASLKITAIK
jgi:hypothetical protein